MDAFAQKLGEGEEAPSLRAARGGGAAAHPRIAILGLLEARLDRKSVV